MTIIGTLSALALACAGVASAQEQGRPSCPARAPRFLADRNPIAAHRLVPRGAVRVTLCKFHGREGRKGSFWRQKIILGPKRIRSLTGASTALNQYSGEGNVECGIGPGTQYLLRFFYAEQPEVDLRIDERTCFKVNNGVIPHFYSPDGRYLWLVEKLLFTD
jgi:hypothetical protein